MSAQTQGERRRYFSLTLKMSYLKSRVNPELPLTNSTEETTFDKNETALGKSKRTRLKVALHLELMSSLTAKIHKLYYRRQEPTKIGSLGGTFDQKIQR